ncbi:O-antigen/teichoic acid export membrane protein [Flavobacterium sp. W4I14]|nr:O-antigen/teichoic acid export membrane protein [Flavobacterium sp. W4I14]
MNNFIKIYFWQVISILFNFGAVFIVTPYISSNQSLYGIYAVVTSAYLFISYADFGFLGAAMKYAAECFAKNNMVDEIKVVGFAAMVFLLFVLIYGLGILYVSISPSLLVSSIRGESEIRTARELLIILAIFCPVFVVQRIVQVIYAVRLQDYKFQRILILSNTVKVLSIFMFFGGGNYLIVEYFLFSQVCTLFAVIAGLIVAKKSLNYDLLLLLKSVRLTKEQYIKTKKLAFTSIFLTLSWILYYELDTFVIVKFLGPNSVAIFTIALTLMTYFRTIFGVFFTPFITKFNYFVGLKDTEGLKAYFLKVMVIFIPCTLFPVLIVIFTAKNFIYTWVGDHYFSSVNIAQVMLMCYLFSFITYPTGILIMANEKVKALYFTSALQPFIYWVGIAITYSFLKLEAFAYFKFIAFFIETIVYIVYILYFFNIKLFGFLKKIIFPIIPSILVLVVILFFTRNYWPTGHLKINLLFYFINVGILVCVSTIVYYFSSKIFRDFAQSLVLNLRQNIFTKLKS